MSFATFQHNAVTDVIVPTDLGPSRLLPASDGMTRSPKMVC